ncbi:MAG TPA: sugar phosphate nucleotidyltransferase [Bacillota bacterium]|nr:sugar phosphate nucleotidyltransferase [Bacillota bacterium]
MQAVILAGGKGTRLKPYTMSFPKPLVPIGDYPILEIIIRQLVRYGFDRITISTGHLAELIMAYFGDGSKWGTKIEYVREEVPLNTAGALKLVQNCEDTFLVMNGDILTTLDYANLLKLHREKGGSATIATKVRESKIDFGVLGIDQEGFLDNYAEKPVYTFSVSMGIYVLNKHCIELIGEGESVGMPDLLLRIKDSGGQVYCHQSDCYWLDIGRVDDYERAQEEFEMNKSLFVDQNE